MGFSQALVTQGFTAKPALLAAEGAFHHKPHFVDGRVAGQLAGTKRLVLDSLVLDAVFDVPFFQGFLVLLAAIRLIRVDTGTRL